MASNPGAAELLSKARNVHSQTGEDGIVEAILGRLPERDGWCVEFGAWDGKHLSNTYRLIDEENYSAVLIEAGRRKFDKLVDTMKTRARVTCVHAFVGFTPADSLDVILERTACPTDFDFLSIDIDGNDYHVWKATEKYRPKLVCIEHNPSIPSSVRYVQPADMGVQQGNSLRSLFELGQEKGYKLVCANLLNAFLVRADLWDGAFAASAEDVADFRKEEPPNVLMFNGYDGTVLLSQDYDMLMHKYRIERKDIQVVPWLVRRHPSGRNPIQRALYAIHYRLKALSGRAKDR